MKSIIQAAPRPLASVFEGIVRLSAEPLPDISISNIVFDSRRVSPGDLFVAVPGTKADGAYYIADAANAGAAAVVTEKAAAGVDVPQILVLDARAALALLAANWHGNPTRSLTVIGVTGTNGKTTTTFLLQSILEEAFGHCGLISTVKYATGARDVSAPNTTPDPMLVQELFAEMKQQGYRAGVMEVSSHSLVQHRTTGVDFDAAVFTNLSGDHLDYHGTMEAYRDAKGLFFSRLGRDASAVLNMDHDTFGYYASVSHGQVATYSLRGHDNALCRGEILRMDAGGLELKLTTPVGETTVALRLLGRYNAENALAATTAAIQVGIDLNVIKRGLEKVKGVPGRVQRVGKAGDVAVVVDYAHTDDALANVLRGLREVTTGRLICVFGCGGDRDNTKRPRMGKVAETMADFAVVTSDNPRTEDPARILEHILQGMTDATRRLVEADRAAAIHAAVAMAKPGDTVLIAGKGHETYQILRDGVIPFDDRQVAEAALNKRAG